MKKIILFLISLMIMNCLVGCGMNHEKVNVNFIIDGQSHLVEIDKGEVISKDIIPLSDKYNVIELYYDEEMENIYNYDKVYNDILIYVKIKENMVAKLNCELYYNISYLLLDTFIEKHITKGAWYNDTLDIDNVLENCTVIVDSDSQFNDVFNNTSFQINLQDQFIIIYAYTTIYGASSCELTEIQVRNNDLVFYVTENSGPFGTGSATRPMTRFLVITLDKLNEFSNSRYYFVIN